MNKIFNFFIILGVFSTILFSQTSIFINEIHYDNISTDTNEGVEIAGPAGIDLTGWSIILYNGSNGATYKTKVLTGTIPDLCNGGVLMFFIDDIQNGPDGIALIDDSDNVIQFLSYEGDFIATNGPANGMTSIDIGVSESTSTPELESLQLQGSGSFYEDFTWTGPIQQTYDDCNTDQALPVELSTFTAEVVSHGVLLSWTTESEIENLGFIIERKTSDSDWNEIVSYKNDESLLGQGTVSNPTDYEYIDKLVQQGNTYEYRLADVDYNGVVTYHATREVYVESNPLATNADSFTVTARPNPFNPSTTIGYNIPSGKTRHALFVRVEIYDINGKLITTLVNKEQSAGWYEIKWNGTNKSGKAVPAGAYLSKVTVGDKVKTNKLTLLR
jgi:hypothetical protein